MLRNGRRKRWSGTKIVQQSFQDPRDFLFRNSPPPRPYYHYFYPNDRYLLFPRERDTRSEKVFATSNRRHFDLWLENGNLALESHENNHGFWARFKRHWMDIRSFSWDI